MASTWLSGNLSLPANVSDEHVGSIPGLERSLGGGNGSPLQDSGLKNLMEPGGLQSRGSQRVRHK